MERGVGGCADRGDRLARRHTRARRGVRLGRAGARSARARTLSHPLFAPRPPDSYSRSLSCAAVAAPPRSPPRVCARARARCRRSVGRLRWAVGVGRWAVGGLMPTAAVDRRRRQVQSNRDRVARRGHRQQREEGRRRHAPLEEARGCAQGKKNYKKIFT